MTDKSPLPNYFPLILPKCRQVALDFFEQFEKDPTSPDTYGALQAKYEKCMEANGIAAKLKLVRVPQQFQTGEYATDK